MADITDVLTKEDKANLKRQIDTMTLEGNGGTFALCLNPASPNFEHVLFKHGSSEEWTKQRKATEAELTLAKQTLEEYRTKVG